MYETRLKGISFLPAKDHKYEQAPYIEITKEEYETYSSQIKKIKRSDKVKIRDSEEKFCDGEACSIG
jgi:hypothetical protein